MRRLAISVALVLSPPLLQADSWVAWGVAEPPVGFLLGALSGTGACLCLAANPSNALKGELVAAPVGAAVGVWAMGEWVGDPSDNRLATFGGALGGAAVGKGAAYLIWNPNESAFGYLIGGWLLSSIGATVAYNVTKGLTNPDTTLATGFGLSASFRF